MPTTLPRYPITRTPEIDEALEAAARRWPEDSDKPRVLLVRLIEEGARAVRSGEAERLERRREAARETSGMFTGLYGEGYLESVREGWPE
jgi:hypothetical protein